MVGKTKTVKSARKDTIPFWEISIAKEIEKQIKTIFNKFSNFQAIVKLLVSKQWTTDIE